LLSTAFVVVGAPAAHATFAGVSGLIAFDSTRDGHDEIYVMDAGGGAQTRLTNNAEGNSQPGWSPDGSKMAFTSQRDGNAEIYVMNADGSSPTRLTNRPTDADRSPTWSPDGTKIAFASASGGTSDIWVMDANGANAVDITNHPADDLAPSWSPDGSKIAFDSARDQLQPANREIFVMGVDGSSPTNVSNHPSFDENPDWSPDGSRILFRSGRSFPGLYTMNADGSSQTALPSSLVGEHGSWSPDGASIVYRSFPGATPEISRGRVDGAFGAVRLTNNAPTFFEDNPDWQPRPGPADPTGEFTPLTPARIVDTRIGTGGKLGKVGAAASFDVQIAGQGGVPASGVSAVVLNATATEPTVASYLTLWPMGFTRPSPSNLNYVPGQTVPNLVTVAINNGKVSVYNNAGATHVVLDVVGYYSSSTGALGSRFHALSPSRLFDTRSNIGGVGSIPLGPGQTIKFNVTGRGIVPAAGVTSVVMNVTVTEPTSSGFVTVYPDDVTRPVASNLNFVPGLTVPNLVVVRVPASGIVDFYNFSNGGGTIHLLADVVGFFDGVKSTEAGRLVSGLPTRLLDTRVSSPAPPPGCVGPGGILTLAFVNPAIEAVVLNVTVTQPTASGYVTVYPYRGAQDPSPPLASNVNYVPGQTVPNLTMVGRGGPGLTVAFYNYAGCTHLVIDAFGAFTSASAPPPSTTVDVNADSYGDVTAGIE